MKTSRGLSLLEVSLAVSVGLILMAGSVYAYRQHMQATRITQAKLMLATVRQGIESYRYRLGVFPPIGNVMTNKNDLNRPFYDLGKQADGEPRRLRDPFYPPHDPALGSRIYDRSLATPEATASWGGWLYNPASTVKDGMQPGEIKPNLPDSMFPGDPPSEW